MSKVIYRPHFREHAEGHLFLGKDKVGAVTIQLIGTAAMCQSELDFYGNLISQALSNLTKEQREEAKRLAEITRS
jgi:hypothetical protein